MKLSKISWWLLTIGVFVIALASLGAVRYQQVNQQSQLNKELTSVELELKAFQLEQLSNRQAQLEKRLSQTISRLDTTKIKLWAPVGSIDNSDILFTLAAAYNVEVTEFSSSSLTREKLAGITLSVLSITATVKGNVPQIVDFITRLNSDLKTGVIKSAVISIPEAISMEKTTADIHLVIYSYQGYQGD